MLVLQDQEWLHLGEKCSYAYRKTNGDKSAVAMLTKHELFD